MVKKMIIAAFMLCLCFLLTGCAGSYIVQEDDIQEVIDELYENWDQVYSFEDSVYTIGAFLEGDAEYTKDHAVLLRRASFGYQQRNRCALWLSRLTKKRGRDLASLCLFPIQMCPSIASLPWRTYRFTVRSSTCIWSAISPLVIPWIMRPFSASRWRAL